MTIDFQGLLNIVKAAENAPDNHRITMNQWAPMDQENICGTSGCLIGTFCQFNLSDELKLKYTKEPDDFYKMVPTFKELAFEEAIAARFNITVKEASFLFTISPLYDRRCFDATDLSGEGAINRLRKFIYYKLHKEEMTYEEARQVSGNQAAISSSQKALSHA